MEVVNIFRFVLKKKYIDLLISLEFSSQKMRECADNVGMNYFHLTQVLNQWKKEEIINKDRTGKSEDITLTSKGKAIVSYLKPLREVVEGRDVSWDKDELKTVLKDINVETKRLDNQGMVTKGKIKKVEVKENESTNESSNTEGSN